MRHFPKNKTGLVRKEDSRAVAIAMYYKIPNTDISARYLPRGLCLTQHTRLHTTGTSTAGTYAASLAQSIACSTSLLPQKRMGRRDVKLYTPKVQ